MQRTKAEHKKVDICQFATHTHTHKSLDTHASFFLSLQLYTLPIDYDDIKEMNKII